VAELVFNKILVGKKFDHLVSTLFVIVNSIVAIDNQFANSQTAFFDSFA
jgi:hypothetical protein